MLRHAPEIMARRREQLTTRRAALETAIADALPDWQYQRPAGGVYLWLQLPCGDAFEVAQMAARHGVLVTPGNGMSVEGSFPDYVRIPFVEPPEVLREGVARLGRAWQAYRSALGGDARTQRTTTPVAGGAAGSPTSAGARTSAGAPKPAAPPAPVASAAAASQAVPTDLTRVRGRDARSTARPG
jgi:hypothetical protein